jgi:D-amino-acid dehydrogenase
MDATAKTIELNKGVSIECDDGKTIDAESVLIAAGAWSGGLMAQLGVRAPLIAERGYHVQSAHHSWPSDLPPTVFEERAVVVTRFGETLRSTSFLEFSSPEAPADPRKWRRLRRHLDELGIEFSKTPETWMGSRPTLPDYLPAIGRLGSNPRVLYAFGHQHLGLTMAAITSEIIEAIANEAPPPFDLAPFRVERFA